MVLILYKGLCKNINTDRRPFSISCQVCLSKSNEKKGEGDRMIFQELEISHLKACHIEKYDLEILEPSISNTWVSDCCLTPTFFFNFSLYHSKNKLIKSPKQRLETYCFCSVSYYYYYYYYSPFFLSVDHELVHGRSQELLDRISWNLVEL
jgi:hypothetical protein